MAYIGNSPSAAVLTSDQIPDGIITATDLATGAAVGNLGYTPLAPAAIGTTVQAFSTNLAAWSALLPTAKQDALVSGTNIKSINGTSILGSGSVSVEPSITAGTTAQYYRGDKSWQTLNALAVGLGNVDNTSDANKPVSTAQQTALNLKANLASPTFTGTVSGITAAMVGLGNVSNTSDATKDSAVATLTNKTLTTPVFTGYTETVYSLVGTDIAVVNGTIQYKTLSANTTFTESLADGQSVTLLINPATFTVTWPTTTWIGSVASTAPTLIASVYNCITLFQVAGTLYGKYGGRV
jgi:hypothetical protein